MNFWINAAKNKEVPVYFVRFEDLIVDPKKFLGEIFSFFLDVDSIEGTIVEKRIEEICNVGHSNSLVYKPRPGGGMNAQMQ